jgi:23S rRNA (cytosine1962-C5)-methyltransferase
MKINDLENILFEKIKNKTSEVKRLFHGRGNFYKNFSFLTVDSLNDIIYICFYEEQSKEKEDELLKVFTKLYDTYSFKALVLQRRYEKMQPNELLKGELERENFVIENGLKYKISFENRNLGLFLDMKKGREFVSKHAKDKKVLNLFSYTCAFSVVALAADAKGVVNVDMSKGALSIGRQNHHLNNLDTKKVKFMPYNILKSWSRIKKEAPYDLIIIDPPSF